MAVMQPLASALAIAHRLPGRYVAGKVPGQRLMNRCCEGMVGFEQSTSGFGALLRRLRTGAGLSQEELAKSAALSPRTLSDLERGISRTARPATARLLADALNLTGNLHTVLTHDYRLAADYLRESLALYTEVGQLRTPEKPETTGDTRGTGTELRARARSRVIRVRPRSRGTALSHS